MSAKSATALEANLDGLRSWLAAHPDLRIEDVQRTLVAGRSHFPYRACVTAADVAGLTAALAACVRTGPQNSADTTVVVISGRCTASDKSAVVMRRADPQFDRLYSQAEQAAGDQAGHPRAGRFAFQYAMYGLLLRIGVESRQIVGVGAGKLVIDASVGRTTLADAVCEAISADDGDAADLDARAERLLARFGDSRVLFIEAGPLSTVSSALARRAGDAHTVVALTEGPDAWPVFLRDLYLAGARWRWAETAGGGRRIELPAYQFDRIRCWLEPANTVTPDGRPGDSEQATAVEPADRTDVLGSVVAAWRSVLGLEVTDPESSFFDLGGDSISGTQVINHLQTVHGVELDSFAIFDYDTPATLTAYIEKVVGGSTAETAVPARSDAAAPLSPDTAAGPTAVPASSEQLSMWLAAEFANGSVAFNLTRSFELTGRVNVDALRRSLDALADRHDALRAVFSYADEELTLLVTPLVGYSVPLELVTVDDDAHGPADITEWARTFAARPFDLARGPLVRAQLVSLGSSRHLLTLCTHHIVVDGWSLGLLIRDLGAYYAFYDRGVPLDLPDIGVGYGAYQRELARQVSSGHGDAAAYWTNKFRDPAPVLHLPGRPSDGFPSYEGSYRHYSLPSRLWLRLREFCQSTGGTVFTTMLSAIAAVLSRYSQHGELVVGTLLAGRHQQSLENLVAMLIRTLPLRLDVDRREGFEQLSRTVRATFVEAVRHSDYPYGELLEELQRHGRLPASGLFDVMVAFQQFGAGGDASLSPLADSGLTARPVEVNLDTSDVPINIMLAEEAGTLHAAIRYDSRRFDASTVDELWTGLSAFLDQALADPSAPLDLIVGPAASGGTPIPAERSDGVPARQPSPVTAGPAEQDPRDRYQGAIAEIWREVLDAPALAETDRFFDVGGNSLRAIKVLARIQSRLGVTLDLNSFFSRPTIAGLADAVAEGHEPPTVTPIPSLGGPGQYGGAPTQDLLMRIDRSSPFPGAFHRNDLHELHGPLDAVLFQRSFEALVARHQSLRTTFDVVDGRTVQTVHAPGVLPLNYRFHDMTGKSVAEISQFVVTRKDEPFETARDPLVRADVIRSREDTHLLLTSIHHVLADGWSAQVLYRDWRELYEASVAGRAAELPALSIQYKDVAAWRADRLTPEVRAAHREFWQSELAGLHHPVRMPADLPRPPVSALDGTRLHLPVPPDLAARFGALAQRHSVTEFTVGTCAAGLLLATTGVTDSLLGTYSLGRDRVVLENLIGSLINTIPLRFRLMPDDTIGSLLTRTQQTILRAFEHEDYPYGDTMRDMGWHRGTERSPLFDVVVNLDQMELGWEAPPVGASLTFVPAELPRRAKQADLQFVFQRYTDGLVLAMSYNTELFSQGRAQSILLRLQGVLEAMTTERSLTDIISWNEFDHE